MRTTSTNQGVLTQLHIRQREHDRGGEMQNTLSAPSDPKNAWQQRRQQLALLLMPRRQAHLSQALT